MEIRKYLELNYNSVTTYENLNGPAKVVLTGKTHSVVQQEKNFKTRTYTYTQQVRKRPE